MTFVSNDRERKLIVMNVIGSISWKRTSIVWLVCWALTGTSVLAQTPPAAETAPAASASGTITEEQITALQSEAAANVDLTQEQKDRASELAQQAISDLQAAAALKEEGKKSEADTANVAQRLAEVERQINEPAKSSELKMDGPTGISELETERNAAQQQITNLEKQLSLPSVDPTARIARRRTVRQFLIEAPNKLQQNKERRAAPPPEGEPAVLTSLRQARLRAEQLAVQEREAAAQQELSLFDAEDAVGLPALSRESITRQLTRLRKKVETNTAEVNRLRQQEAETRVREAKWAAIGAEPLLKPILEANGQIAKEEKDVRMEHEQVQKTDKEIDQQLADLRKDFLEIQTYDKEFGLTAAVGLRLRKLRSQLPNLRAHQMHQQARFETLEQAQMTLYQRMDELDDLDDLEAAAEKRLSNAEGLDGQRMTQVVNDALTALRAQREYLNNVVAAYRNYTDTLTKLDQHEQELIELTKDFAAFIDERVLWVRSHPPLHVTNFLSDRESVSWLWDASNWAALGRAIAHDMAKVPLLYGAVAALFVFLQVLHGRVGRRLHELSKRAQSRVTVSVVPTVLASEYTLLPAIIWPGLMGFLSWRLWLTGEPRIVLATAVTLSRLAGLLLLLEIIRQSMRPNGLCEDHFGLPSATARRMRRRLRQLMFLGIPLAGIVSLIHFYNGDDPKAFIERLLFIAVMLMVSYFAHALLHRSRGDLRELHALSESRWTGPVGLMWYVLAVGLPLVLAGLAATGYYYSAQKLTIRCQITLCLLLCLFYLRAFLLRWLMLRHRRLRLQQLRERQAALAAQAAATTDEAGASLPETSPDEIDLNSVSRQSQRLVTTTFLVVCLCGVWMIWTDVVPALGFLDRWPLWTHVVQVREEYETKDGLIDYRTRDVDKPVTIVHLTLAALIVVLTMTAARNLPGLLEITILQKLPLDRSTTYAITALVRYSLVLIGIMLASMMLGIGWSKVQWLAAALTFGLGFGLQEIFANFVSGIIILFEQPVRVGDVVTIDGVSGVVNRIRIRATTIVDWDRKEYIVPNREFITGRLLNWTLSDKMNRVVINVGVAYGSDTDLVRETILGAASEHENVLEDPPPLVTFEEFGDSALNFVLRAYLPSLDSRLLTIHDLHMEINKRLKTAGIEIPFPQRDLHLKTSIVLADKGQSGSNGHHIPAPRETVESSSN